MILELRAREWLVVALDDPNAITRVSPLAKDEPVLQRKCWYRLQYLPKHQTGQMRINTVVVSRSD